jgi:hypothetical protein
MGELTRIGAATCQSLPREGREEDGGGDVLNDGKGRWRRGSDGRAVKKPTAVELSLVGQCLARGQEYLGAGMDVV